MGGSEDIRSVCGIVIVSGVNLFSIITVERLSGAVIFPSPVLMPISHVVAALT
jgi:hypothetical protein